MVNVTRGRIFTHSVRTLSVDRFLKRLCSAGRLDGGDDDTLLSGNQFTVILPPYC
jgi:hypothetical protein